MASLGRPLLRQLITEIRGFLNQRDSDNSNWTDEDLTQWVNNGIRRYFLELSSSNEGYFTTTIDLNITKDEESIALPSDFFKIRNLYIKNNNSFEILQYDNNLTQSYSTEGGTSISGYRPRYHFRQNNLILRPVPNFTSENALRLEYIQFPEMLLNGGDQMTDQISPIFRDLIIANAVYLAKMQESLVTGVNTGALAKQHRDEHYTEFREMIQRRSKNPTFTKPFNPEFN